MSGQHSCSLQLVAGVLLYVLILNLLTTTWTHAWALSLCSDKSRRPANRAILMTLTDTATAAVVTDGEGDPVWSDIPRDVYGSIEDLPTTFAYPFRYEPHPVAMWAAERLQEKLSTVQKYKQALCESGVGKMWGVLVVLRQSNSTIETCLGYLSAYSGTLASVSDSTQDGFCPPIYNRRTDPSGFYARGEAQLNALNAQVQDLETSVERVNRRAHLAAVQRETQEELAHARQMQKIKKEERRIKRVEMEDLHLEPDERAAVEEELLQEGAAIQRQIKALKAHVKERVAAAQAKMDEMEEEINQLKATRQRTSAALQDRLFEQYQFLNMSGQRQSLLPIFAQTPLQRPPSGAGDCAAPRLLQYAFARGYRPVALAEFWWGPAPPGEVRRHGLYYPACRGKCEPILMRHMLRGMRVAPDPLEGRQQQQPDNSRPDEKLETLFEDAYMVVVNKPHDMLSVPGRHVSQSVYSIMKERYPDATGPLLVHRLDLSTSGILLVAKDAESHKGLQRQFIQRTVQKRYTALLEGAVSAENNSVMEGLVDLPLSPDYLNRPMQKVDHQHGKPAVTRYEIVEQSETDRDGHHQTTRVHFFPQTGRTHQLRVHAAHHEGLDRPIVGDDIYGRRDGRRLCLHAGYLQVNHPVSGERLTFRTEDPF